MESIPTLERLSLNTTSKNSIDFTRLPRLQNLFVNNLAKRESIFKCAWFKDLYIYNFPDENVDRVSQIIGLEGLTLGPARRLVNLTSLPRSLTRLAIYLAPKLADVNQIETLTGLRRLEFHGCRSVSSIDFAKGLSRLEVLHLVDCGPIDSLKPLGACLRLRSLVAYGSTRIVDDDLSALSELPLLAGNVAMARRRTYFRFEAFME